jgi:hypothetical protein
MTMFERLHDTALADTDLLRKNDKLGDIFTKARQVDFAFETGDRQRADDFAEFVNEKNYGTAALSTSHGWPFPSPRSNHNADHAVFDRLRVGIHAVS